MLTTFVEIFETSDHTKGRRRLYAVALCVAYTTFLLFNAARFAGWPIAALRAKIVDFHDFYAAGILVNQGRVETAYAIQILVDQQRALFGQVAFMPWTYPPQFDLLIGLLAHLPFGLAYLIFICATLSAYVLIIRRLAPEWTAGVFMLMSPSILMTIGCGQNGFLTGSLIGATAIGLVAGRSWAGIPLGLMIIKPHLAVAFALYTLLTRRWHVMGVAGITIALTSAVATAALGVGVWIAFFDAAKSAGQYLSAGDYPEFRMISGYAMVHSLGFSSSIATCVQLVFAASAILATTISAIRFNQRQAIGVAALASVMISPYAYDYDMPVFGIGVAMLLGDLSRYGTLPERVSLYTFVFGVQFIAYASAIRSLWNSPHTPMPASVGCLSLIATLALACRILERSRVSALAKAEAGGHERVEAGRLVSETIAV